MHRQCAKDSAITGSSFGVDQVVAMEPMSWDGRTMLVELGVQLVRNAQFLCHYEDFAEWGGPRKRWAT